MKYSQLTGSMSYDKMKEICKKNNAPNLNIRKMGRFYTELLFLSKYAKKGDRILYVGAAPGLHIWKLADLFPKCDFELWDPLEIKTPDRKNIIKFTAPFTDQDAREYSKYGKKILFISDILNLNVWKSIRNDDSDELYKLVDSDMDAQKKWCQIIVPKIAYMKFRLPYDGSLCKYFVGTLYLNPYLSVTSEALLSTSDYETLVPYDSEEFDGKISYYHATYRCNEPKKTIWFDIMQENKIKYIHDNIQALKIANMYVMSKKDYPKTKKKQLQACVDFFLESIKDMNDDMSNIPSKLCHSPSNNIS